MTWAKLSDDHWRDPAFVEVGLAASGLWCRMSSWSCANLKDGFVPRSQMVLIAGGAKWAPLVEKLVRAGKLTPTGDNSGWTIDGFLDVNPSRDQVLARREADAARIATWRAKQAAAKQAAAEPDDPPPDNDPCNGVTNPATNSVSSRVPYPSPYPYPGFDPKSVSENSSSLPVEDDDDTPLTDDHQAQVDAAMAAFGRIPGDT